MQSGSPNNDTVAYIPARLGSERVPKKNLRHLGGRPLVTMWQRQHCSHADLTAYT